VACDDALAPAGFLERAERAGFFIRDDAFVLFARMLVSLEAGFRVTSSQLSKCDAPMTHIVQICKSLRGASLGIR
jgi:hypothetical protein